MREGEKKKEREEKRKDIKLDCTVDSKEVNCVDLTAMLNATKFLYAFEPHLLPLPV
jgi:hypothetical protein